MTRLNLFALCTVASTALLFVQCSTTPADATSASDAFKKMKPYEAEAWKWSAPDAEWDAWHAANVLDEVDRWKFEHITDGAGTRTIEGEWRLEGPTNIGGRFNFIRQHPEDPTILYAGSSAGGLWKGSGSSEWQPLTEEFPAMSMGDLTCWASTRPWASARATVSDRTPGTDSSTRSSAS